MANMHLTKRTIEALKPKAHRYFVIDDKQRGLAVAVQPSGAKAFYLYRRIDGRPRQVHIGPFPDITVEQARAKADTWNGQVAEGKNPIVERRRERKNRWKLGDIWEDYRTKQLEPKSTAPSLAEDKRRYSKHLETWATWSLDEIEPGEVAGLHAKIGKDSPVEANRVIQLLKRIINHGVRFMGWQGVNPCLHIKRFPEQSRERFLDGAELQRLFAVLSGKPVLADPKKPDGDVLSVDADVIDFLKLALLTGARRNNVLKMRWDDLDLDKGLWRIPSRVSKNKQPMTVILPPAAVTILQGRTRLDGVEDVFRRANGKFPYVVKQWSLIRKAAGLKDVRMHDLRRTLGSWAAGTGASLPIIGKALGHRTPSSTAIYSRLDVDPVRRAVEIATSAMLAFDQNTPSLPAPMTD